MPETSIIIRTFNEQKYIGKLLQAIREQDYQDYEIILVDSGSTDDTLSIAKNFADKILQIESRDFTFGYSLNYGCKRAQGKYIVIISGHAIPTNQRWLSNLLAPFQDKKVAMVYGRQIGTEQTRFSEQRDFKKLFGTTFLKFDASFFYANNANSAIRKELWQEYPFREHLFGLEDIDWAKYVIEKGFNVVYTPEAVVYHIHQETWSQVYNRYRREAIAAKQIGLLSPPQVNPSWFWLVQNLAGDLISALPNLSWERLKDICHFRYTQWIGTRKGWYQDKYPEELEQERYALYYPAVNKAVVITGPNRVLFQEMPLPEMKPSEVLIRVAYVGVCRTDLEVYQGKLGYYLQGRAKYPIVPGHEFSGEILRLGANSRKYFKIGERVVGECILSCGNCSFCVKGLNAACLKRKEVGVMNYNGAYAKFIVLPAQYLHRIPNGLDLKIACLTEPLAVALKSFRRLTQFIKTGDRWAVIGAGPLGNFFVQILWNQGYKVAVFDKNKERLRFLKGKAEIFQTLEGLEKFDLIVEATGCADSLKTVLEKSRSGATILLLGFPYGNINYNFENLVGFEKLIMGSLGGAQEDFQEALKLLPKLDTSPFVQKILPLEEYFQAWKLQQQAKYLKIILKV